MGSISSKALFLIAGVFIFLGSLSIIISSLVQQERLIDLSVIVTSRADHRLFTEYKIADQEIYTGSQIIFTIYNQNMKTDIQVGNVTIYKNTNLENIDLSFIDRNKYYKVNYLINDDGSINKITFS